MWLKLDLSRPESELTNGNCGQRHNVTKCLRVVVITWPASWWVTSYDNPNEANAADTAKFFTAHETVVPSA